MSFDKAPIIETERLILRPHQVSDFEAYHQMWVDPDVLRYTILEPRSEQDAWMTMQRIMGGWPMFGFGMWALELKAEGAFIGDAGFMEARRPLTPDKRGVPELGYALATPWKGRGLMSEALTAVHAWLDANRPGSVSFALIDDDNLASIRVAEKNGYVFERRADSDQRKSALYTRNRLPQAPTKD